MNLFLLILAVLALSIVMAVIFRVLQLDQQTLTSLNNIELRHRHSIESLQEEVDRRRLEIENIAEAVDLSTHSVEKIHQSIADTSFGLLSTVKQVKKPSRVLHKAHDKTAKEVYSSIRKVNRLMGGLSKSLSSGNSARAAKQQNTLSKDLNDSTDKDSGDKDSG